MFQSRIGFYVRIEEKNIFNDFLKQDILYP